MTAPDSPTRSPLTGVTVLDAMNPGVVSCLPDDGVAKLASIMVARRQWRAGRVPCRTEHDRGDNQTDNQQRE